MTFYNQLMEIGDIYDHVHGQESLVLEKMNVTAFTELEHIISMLNIALAGKNLFCIWNKAATSFYYQILMSSKQYCMQHDNRKQK